MFKYLFDIVHGTYTQLRSLVMVFGHAFRKRDTLQYPEENRGLIPMFTGMDHVRFRSPVLPGDVLVTKAVIKKIIGRMGKVHCECTVGDVHKAEADFLFYLMDPTATPEEKK